MLRIERIGHRRGRIADNTEQRQRLYRTRGHTGGKIAGNTERGQAEAIQNKRPHEGEDRWQYREEGRGHTEQEAPEG